MKCKGVKWHKIAIYGICLCAYVPTYLAYTDLPLSLITCTRVECPIDFHFPEAFSPDEKCRYMYTALYVLRSLHLFLLKACHEKVSALKSELAVDLEQKELLLKETTEKVHMANEKVGYFGFFYKTLNR